MEQSKQDHAPTGINRRQFLILAAAGVAAPKAVEGNPTADRLVDAGPVSNYAVEGLYSGFRDQGFFLVRRGALTACALRFLYAPEMQAERNA